jgi:hypothetical protein
VVGAVGKYADPFGALLGKNVQEFMHEKIPTQVNESLSGIAKKDPFIRADRKYGFGRKGSPLRSTSNWARDKPGDTTALVLGALAGGSALAGAFGGGAAGGAGGGAAGGGAAGGTAAPAQAGWTQYAQMAQMMPQGQQQPPPQTAYQQDEAARRRQAELAALRQQPSPMQSQSVAQPIEEVVVTGQRMRPPPATPSPTELAGQSASIRDAFAPKLSPMEMAQLRTSLLRRNRNAY